MCSDGDDQGSSCCLTQSEESSIGNIEGFSSVSFEGLSTISSPEAAAAGGGHEAFVAGAAANVVVAAEDRVQAALDGRRRQRDRLHGTGERQGAAPRHRRRDLRGRHGPPFRLERWRPGADIVRCEVQGKRVAASFEAWLQLA